MQQGEQITVALVWAQFAAYHIDRCEAVARRLQARAQIIAVEVATTSADYAWEPSGEIAGARKITLFPGQSYNAISGPRRLWALLLTLRRCDWVMIGLSYAEPGPVLLSWLLRLCGVKLIVFSESKQDDKPRRALVEWGKRLALSCYHGAIVGAGRHRDYFRLLGFRRRPVLMGYDGVSIARVRQQAGNVLAPAGAEFSERPFVFVGRFVDKKNLITLIEAFAAYAAAAGSDARRLVLVGSGEEEAAMRQRIAALGVTALVGFPGFLSTNAVSRQLASALGLVLVSRVEQWGLVVNEALALGLPAIVSRQVGARDALVRDGENGFVVDSEDVGQIAEAMLSLGKDRQLWEAMVAASHDRAWLGDSERLADAAELMLDPGSEPVTSRIAEFEREVQ